MCFVLLYLGNIIFHVKIKFAFCDFRFERYNFLCEPINLMGFKFEFSEKVFRYF